MNSLFPEQQHCKHATATPEQMNEACVEWVRKLVDLNQTGMYLEEAKYIPRTYVRNVPSANKTKPNITHPTSSPVSMWVCCVAFDVLLL